MKGYSSKKLETSDRDYTSNTPNTQVPVAVDFGAGAAEKVLIDRYNEWRTANPYRPFRIYHLKLVLYLALQIVEWLTDLAVVIYLEVETETANPEEYEGRHRLTAICYFFFLVAPWFVVGSLITAGRFIYSRKHRINNNCLKITYMLPYFVFYIIYYGILDVCYTFYFAIVESLKYLYILVKDLIIKRKSFNEDNDWIYIPPSRIRSYMFFRGIYQFWFETVPHVILLGFISYNGYLRDELELLAWAYIVAFSTFLMNLIKVIRFYKQSRLRVYEPAFFSVYALVFHKEKKKKSYKVRTVVAVQCSVQDFPWVDFYNDVYMKMLIKEIPNSGLDYFKNICRLASRTWQMQEFHAPNCCIADAGPLSINHITEAMRKNKGMKILNLSNNIISDQGAANLTELIRCNTSLKSLNLSHNKISEDGINFMSGALKVNTTLSAFDISYNNLKHYGGKALGSMLNFNFNLQDLRLTSCGLTEEGMKDFGKGLSQNKALKRLWLRYNDIKDDGLIELSKALAVNNTLQEIALEGNAINDIGVIELCDVLTENNSLSTLELVGNKVSDQGAEALGNVIWRNEMLQRIYLSGNKIGDKGAIALAAGLEKAQFLKHISLVSNVISDEGAAAFGQAIGKNESLKELYLRGNNIQNDGLVAIAHGLKNNKALVILSLDGNPYTDSGAMSLRSALMNNSYLNVLDLEISKLSEVSVDGFKELNNNKDNLTINFKQTLTEGQSTSISIPDDDISSSKQDKTALAATGARFIDIPAMIPEIQFANSATLVAGQNLTLGIEDISNDFYKEFAEDSN